MHNITNNSKLISKNALEMICDQHVDKLSLDDKEILK